MQAADAWEQAPLPELQAAAMKVLSTLFGERASAPVACAASRWKSEPYVQGKPMCLICLRHFGAVAAFIPGAVSQAATVCRFIERASAPVTCAASCCKSEPYVQGKLLMYSGLPDAVNGSL